MPNDRLIRAVIDTNVFVSGLIAKRGIPHALLQAFYAGVYRILLSAPLQEEYERVLARPTFTARYNLSAEDVAAFFGVIARRAQFVTLQYPSPIEVRDAHDEHVLATALNGNADYLVSGDNDLLVLAGDTRLGALQIVTPRAFLERLPSAL